MRLYDRRVVDFEIQKRSYYEFWREYIAFSIYSPLRQPTCNSTIIRWTAEFYCRMAGTTDDGSIRKCVEALANSAVHNLNLGYFGVQLKNPQEPGSHQQNILLAFVCMKNVSVASQVLSTPHARPFRRRNKCDFQHTNTLFACPAMALGGYEMLGLFLLHRTEPYSGCIMWNLSRSGSLRMLEFVMQFKPPLDYLRCGGDVSITTSDMYVCQLNPDPKVVERAHGVYTQLCAVYPEWQYAKWGAWGFFPRRKQGLQNSCGTSSTRASSSSCQPTYSRATAPSRNARASSAARPAADMST